MKTTIYAPGVQWVVLEDLEHGQDHLRVVAQYAQGFLRTTLENPLRTRSAHPINDVRRHAERDTLWNWE
jgi:hypothetical protein